MKYLHAVMLETQRLFPLIVTFSRETLKDMELSGYQIPKGNLFLCSKL